MLYLSGCSCSACSSTPTISFTLHHSKNSLSTHSLHNARAAHMVTSTCTASNNGCSRGTIPQCNRHVRDSECAAKFRQQTHALEKCHHGVCALTILYHLHRISRMADAATEVGSEGRCFMRQRLRASATPFKIKAWTTVAPPPPEMFLMQPNMYLSQTSATKHLTRRKERLQHNIKIRACLGSFGHQLKQTGAGGKKRIV